MAVLGCKSPEARRPVTQNSGSFINESIQRNKKLVAKEEAIILKMIERDSSHTYIASSNGFWYYYVQKDNLNKRLPQKGDEVSYSYEIKDIDNHVIYSKEQLGIRKYRVDEQELISGLQDGIKLMKEGETITFLFPSHKAYGYAGYDKINSGQPLIYTVTLQKIIPNK